MCHGKNIVEGSRVNLRHACRAMIEFSRVKKSQVEPW